MSWIRVKDKLPEEDERIICYGLLVVEDYEQKQENDIHMVYYRKFGNEYRWESIETKQYSSSPSIVKDVNAWQPLPSAPEEYKIARVFSCCMGGGGHTKDENCYHT